MTKYDLGFLASWAVPMESRPSEVLENIFVGIREGKIEALKPFKSSDRARCKKFIDRRGMVALPGLVNSHTHLPMTLFRGVAENLELQQWLHERIFPLEKKFVSAKFVELGTELAAFECLRFGTTTVNDMYFFPEVEMQVWDRMGLRGIFSLAFADFPLPDDNGKDRAQEFERIHQSWKNHPRLQLGVGPHAPYTCSNETLKKCRALADRFQAPITMHLLETLKEATENPMDRLRALQFFNRHTSLAHGVHLGIEDIKTLAQAGSSVVHCPDSNSKLGSGIAPVREMLDQNLTMGLGTDGSASANDLSLFGAMDLACKLQNQRTRSARGLRCEEALWMATHGGAKALGLSEKIGSLAVGKEADIIFVDFNHPHLQPVNDVIAHLVHSCQGLEVDSVVVAGKILMKDKKPIAKPKALKASALEKIRKDLAATLKSLAH